MSDRPSPGTLAASACLMEATARKPGNVHPGARFRDCTFLDFALSAAAIAGPLDRAATDGVGAAILAAVESTRQVVSTNTNLGMILLLAPLAAVPSGVLLDAGIGPVLDGLTVADARLAYRAIRLAQPGGLGATDEQDVHDEPTVTLLDAMRLATERDGVARQYATTYADIFGVALPALRQGLTAIGDLESAIIFAYLSLLADRPDTLILRKRGPSVAGEASRRAAAVLATGSLERDSPGLADFDAWLRADGHARNPGTTADLIAATLFVALRDGTLSLPLDSTGTIV